MIRRISLLFVAVVLLVVPGFPQQKTKGAEAPVSVQDLVLAGKTAEAVKIAVKTPSTLDGTWSALMTAIDTQIILRNLDKAQSNLTATKSFADACEKSKQIKNIPMDSIQGRQLRLSGIRLSDSKEYTKAVETLNQALELSRKAKDRGLEAGVHNNLGYALQYQGKLADAEKEYDQARLIAEELKDNLRAGSSNYNLGNVLFAELKFADAIAAFKRAGEQAKSSGRTDIEARATMMLGIATSKNDLKGTDALTILQDAEGKFEKLGDFASAAQCYTAMSEHIGMSGDFIRTLETGEKAIPLLIKAGDKMALQRVYDFLATIAVAIPKPDKADEYRKKSEELSKELEVQKANEAKKNEVKKEEIKKDGAVKK